MGDTAKVSSIPSCDIHADDHPAVYDGATKRGPWAYMCEDAFQQMGVGLGTGQGQLLVLEDADPIDLAEEANSNMTPGSES